jgi:hypothetical protein
LCHTTDVVVGNLPCCHHPCCHHPCGHGGSRDGSATIHCCHQRLSNRADWVKGRILCPACCVAGVAGAAVTHRQLSGGLRPPQSRPERPAGRGVARLLTLQFGSIGSPGDAPCVRRHRRRGQRAAVNSIDQLMLVTLGRGDMLRALQPPVLSPTAPRGTGHRHLT